MEISEAFNLIAHAIDSHQKSGGYLIVGDLSGNTRELVERILAKLYPGDAEKLATHSHPDVFWIEPQGKSRTIKVERSKSDNGPGIRDGIVAPMSVTSYSGGWKVGVIAGADRMQLAAANSFLKSLEEPTPRTLYLLLTDRPDAVLPTIISRCQRIDLPLPKGLLEGDEGRFVADVFESKSMGGVHERAQAAKFLAANFAELKGEADDEEVAFVRKRFYQTIMSYVRRWMEDGSVPRHLAFRNIEAVEEAYSRSERYLPEDAVLSFMMDKLVFPA